MLRYVKTRDVIQALQAANIPVIVLTARFFDDPKTTIEAFVDYAKQMENGTGLSFSKGFEGVRLDFRETGLTAVFDEGIAFSPEKSKAAVSLIDHPNFQGIRSNHYVFVDDNLDQINAMMEAFKRRTEHLIALHYPVEIDHAFLEPTCQSLNSGVQRLSFLLRNAYFGGEWRRAITELLKECTEERIMKLKRNHNFPFFVDALMGNDIKVIEEVFQTFQYNSYELKSDEKMSILKHLNDYNRSDAVRWFIGNVL